MPWSTGSAELRTGAKDVMDGSWSVDAAHAVDGDLLHQRFAGHDVRLTAHAVDGSRLHARLVDQALRGVSGLGETGVSHVCSWGPGRRWAPSDAEHTLMALRVKKIGAASRPLLTWPREQASASPVTGRDRGLAAGAASGDQPRHHRTGGVLAVRAAGVRRHPAGPHRRRGWRWPPHPLPLLPI